MKLWVVEAVKGAGGTGSIEDTNQLGMEVVVEEEYHKAVAKTDLADGFAAAKVHEVHCFRACEAGRSFEEVEIVQELSE